MASVFNGGTGSAFGASGGGGRSFGQFRLTNPNETGFGKYINDIMAKGGPMRDQLGLVGSNESPEKQQFAFDTYYQYLADQGASPAQIRAMRNKQQSAMSAYAVRQQEPGTLSPRLANFLAELDAQGSWQGWSPVEGQRQQPMQRIRFA